MRHLNVPMFSVTVMQEAQRADPAASFQWPISRSLSTWARARFDQVLEVR